jgi:hypothetical protein
MRIDPDTCRDPDLLAAEVRRLRSIITASEPRLTDDEREAVATAMHDYAADNADEACAEIEATLRGLLERL